MKINLGRCTRCGKYCLLAEVNGMRAVAEMEPLSLDGTIRSIAAGRTVYVLRTDDQNRPKGLAVALTRDLRNAEGLTLLGDHEHSGAVRPAETLSTPQTAPCTDPALSGRQAGAQGPSWPSQDATATPARAVTPSRSSRKIEVKPCCDACAQPCADGTYAAVHLGDLLVWAQHLEGECGT